MAKKRGGAFGTLFALGLGAAAGVAAYKNRELIRDFFDTLTGTEVKAERAPAEPEDETDIVIDRSGDGEEG